MSRSPDCSQEISIPTHYLLALLAVRHQRGTAASHAFLSIACRVMSAEDSLRSMRIDIAHSSPVRRSKSVPDLIRMVTFVRGRGALDFTCDEKWSLTGMDYIASKDGRKHSSTQLRVWYKCLIHIGFACHSVRTPGLALRACACLFKSLHIFINDLQASHALSCESSNTRHIVTISRVAHSHRSS